MWGFVVRHRQKTKKKKEKKNPPTVLVHDVHAVGNGSDCSAGSGGAKSMCVQNVSLKVWRHKRIVINIARNILITIFNPFSCSPDVRLT